MILSSSATVVHLLLLLALVGAQNREGEAVFHSSTFHLPLLDVPTGDHRGVVCVVFLVVLRRGDHRVTVAGDGKVVAARARAAVGFQRGRL